MGVELSCVGHNLYFMSSCRVVKLKMRLHEVNSRLTFHFPLTRIFVPGIQGTPSLLGVKEHGRLSCSSENFLVNVDSGS